MSRRWVEFILVGLVALIALLVFILVIFRPPGSGACTTCQEVSLPLQREECEKQFSGGVGQLRRIEGGSVDEYQVAFFDPSLGSGDGYTPPPTSGTPVAQVAGFIMTRARPSTYDSSTGAYSSNTFDPNNVKAGQVWDQLRFAVSTYASPLRNDPICHERGVSFFKDKFEAFCNLPTDFRIGNPQKQTFRAFVVNDGPTPVDYCIVSNCDVSVGKICQVELTIVP